MLAMYVVLENYLGMVCDYPAAYEGQPGFEFLRAIPTNWDETKVLDAKVCEYIVIARRKNNDWYIGSITNHEPRQFQIPMNFLPTGNYSAEIYTDALDVRQYPNHLEKEIRNLTNADIVSLHIAAGGGAVMHLRKN
jgi:alpha-glucosidase